METIDKATAKVRRWRRIADGVWWAMAIVPLALALILWFMDAGTKSQRWFSFLALWVILVIAGVIAERRRQAAIKAHPLYYLVMVREAFGEKP